MIYFDKDAPLDTNACPALREEPCINCNKNWASHCGWRCLDSGEPIIGGTNFNDVSADIRFVTLSMYNSLGASPRTTCLICKKDKCCTIDCG